MKLIKISSLKIIAFSLLSLFISGAHLYAQTYYKPLPSLPITFDPKLYHDAYSILVASQIYDHLFDVDELSNLKPKLASSWSSKNNGQTWVINLRTDVLFHNGKKFTAEDVKFSLERLLETNSLKQYELSIIDGAKDFYEKKSKTVKGIKILSPNSLQIDLTAPFPPFLTTFAAPNTEIIPTNYAGIQKDKFFEKPIGTGPFKFEKYDKNKMIQLTANEKYFLGKPKIETIIFEKADSQKALSGFNNGYYHDAEFFYFEPEDIKRSFISLKAPQAETNIIAFNTTRPPFNNIHVRNAIVLSIDKEKLFQQCFSQHILANSYIPPGLGGHNPNIFKSQFNIQAALREIQLAKVPQSVLSKQYTLIRPDNHPCQKGFSNFIQEALKKIGLNVKIENIPLNELILKNQQKDYDLYNLTFTADYPEALFMLNLFKSDYPFNFGGGKLPDYDKLLETASHIQDKYERYNMYQKAQEILRDNSYIIPLYHRMATGVFQTNVRGIERNPFTLYVAQMGSIYFANEPSK